MPALTAFTRIQGSPADHLGAEACGGREKASAGPGANAEKKGTLVSRAVPAASDCDVPCPAGDEAGDGQP